MTNSKNIFIRLTRITLIVVFAVSITTQSQSPVEQRSSIIIAPGIEHLEIKRGDFTAEAGDRWQINVLVIDPAKSSLKLARAMDEMVGAETTSSMAIRHRALAAINAGYFRVAGTYRGEPMGTLVLQDKVMSEDVNQRSSLAITNTNGLIKAALASIETKIELIVRSKDSKQINGINRPREKDELVIYTPEFHRTTLTAPDGIEVVVRNNRVAAVFENNGSQLIPLDGFVISAHGVAREWIKSLLKLRVKVELKSQINAKPKLPFQPEFIVGGGPMLLTEGEVQTDPEHFNPDSFINFRHPRTAFGIRQNGTLILVTVDGRQPKKSVGMTIPELKQLMKDLGCTDAINLDGGGSTTMVVHNKVVNSISDATGERPVSDALLIFSKK